MGTSSPSLVSSQTSALAKIRQIVTLCVAIEAVVLLGFYLWHQLAPAPRRGYQFDSKTLQFVDHAQSNSQLDACDVGSLKFRTHDGQPTDLKKFRDKQNVVLVVTRGNTSGVGPGAYYRTICLYCATQTSRLIANYQAFRDQNAEVVVVFPIRQAADSGSLATFREALERDGATANPPFPLMLDEEMHAVDQLGIRADLSKPATYILDKQGHVRFAYVGANLADRPSVSSMLEQLALINADGK